MKSSREIKLYQEDTVGDGNCAYNAFVLGLCQKSVLEALEQQIIPDRDLKEFIERAAIVLKTENRWSAVRAKMLELRESNKRELQKALAPIMRYLSIEMAKKDARHIEKTIEPLLSVFQNHIFQVLNIPAHGVSDDIFNRHDFINTKLNDLALVSIADLRSDLTSFNEDEFKRLRALKSRSADETARLRAMERRLADVFNEHAGELNVWWRADGYQTFLDNMSKDAVWAGDLELAEVAAYFHVNLDITRDQFYHSMHIDHGEFPLLTLSNEQVTQLMLRGIIDKPQPGATTAKLLAHTREEVVAKLSAVPEVDTVRAQIVERVEVDGVSLSKKPISAELSDACKQELIARTVIARDKGSDKYYFTDIIVSEANERISAIDDKDGLLALWDANYKDTPTVTLTNPSANHWSNMSVSVVPEERVAPKSILSEVSKTLLLINDGKIKPTNEKWQVFVERKIGEDLPVAAEKSVEYTVSPTEGTTAIVSIETQIELDKELAMRLQAEEYQKGISSELQEELDRQIAERLQDEERRGYKM